MTAGRARASIGSFLRDPMVWGWLAVWAVTRALMVVQVGFWDQVNGVNYQDAEFYKNWSDTLAHQHVMPSEESWQYPPGAAFLFLIPRLGGLIGKAYQPSFMVTMLVVDLVGTLLMIWLARRTGRQFGVWVWLLAIPLLQANPITRFDLVPTVLTMGALVVIHRRPVLFGVLAGAGAAIKVWPVVALLGEWNRRRLLVSAMAALAAIAFTFLVAASLFGDQSSFFDNQDVRGLQKEAVADIPWYGKWTVTGIEPPLALRSGSAEIGTDLANSVAVALKWLGLLVLLAAALWWIGRDRAIRRGRTDLADPSLARDFVFAIVLLQVVVSRVLSPQYLIWLIGILAVILSAGPTRLRRPAYITLAAIIFSPAIYIAPANMMVRNFALLLAALDAAWIMWRVLRDPAADPVSAESSVESPLPARAGPG